MKNKRLAILLSSNSIDAALYDASGVSRSASLPIETEDQASLWDAALTHADTPLASIIDQLDCAGAQTVVAYHSPTAFADVFHCSTTGGAFSNAARLALTDRTPFDVSESIQRVAPWGADKASENNRSHAIIAAETQYTSITVASWIERAGLNLTHATPINTASLASMLNQLAVLEADKPTICINIGERTSAIGFVRDKHILLARRVELTRSDLHQALLRPIVTSDEQTHKPLDEESAAQILSDHGIPAPNDTITDDILGRDLLPLLQPLLQRFVVETRQLFRFGVEQEDRENAVIRVTGCGASIPNLAKIISEQLEIPLDEHAPDPDTIHSTDLDMLVDAVPMTPNLIPPPTVARINRNRFKRALVAGAVFAGVLSAVDAGLTLVSTNQLRSDAANIASQATTAETLLQAKAQAQASNTKLQALRAAATEYLAPQADFAALLKEISTLTPDWVSLSSVVSNRDEENISFRIDGAAFQSDPAEPPQIEQYIDTLTASPLIAQVTLGATHSTTLDRDEALRFSLQLEIVAYPPTLASTWESTP